MDRPAQESLNRLGRLYDKTLGKLIPRYAFWACFFLVVFNCAVYYAVDLILGEGVVRGTIALPWDHQIPLIEEFIIFYFGSYLLWVACPIFFARRSEKIFFDVVVAVSVSLIITFLFFIFFPLSIERPAEVTGDNIFADMVRFLYSIDKPHNLFPSLHCYYSWLCFAAVRGKKGFHPGIQIFLFFTAIAIFASTVFLRQHYLLDIVAGAVLAELSLLLAKTPLPSLTKRAFGKCSRAFFEKRSKT